jgi:hypothetical protein
MSVNSSSLYHLGGILGLSPTHVNQFVDRCFADSGSSNVRDLYDYVGERIRDVAVNNASAMIRVPFVLNTDESAKLYKIFPEYDLDLVGQRFSGVSVDFYKSIKYLLKLSVYNLVKKSLIVDYSGEFEDAVIYTKKDNVIYHNIMTYAKHEVSVTTQLEALKRRYSGVYSVESLGDRLNMASFMRSIGKKSSRICTNDCVEAHDASYAFFDHLNYDIPIEQVAMVALQHNYMVVYGMFMFDTDMFMGNGTGGVFKHTGISYEIENDRVIIASHDPLMEKSFCYKNILKMAMKNSIKLGKYVFTLELIKRKGEFFVYKMVNIGDEVEVATSHISHAIWFNDLSNKKLLTSYALRNSYLDPNIKQSYCKRLISVPADIYNDAKEYANGIKTGDMSVEDIEAYIRILSSRQIVKGVDFVHKRQLTADQEEHLTYAVYSAAFMERFDHTDTARFLRDSLMERTGYYQHGTWTMFIKTIFYNCINVIKKKTYTDLCDWFHQRLVVRRERLSIVPIVTDAEKRMDFCDLVNGIEHSDYSRTVANQFNKQLGYGHIYLGLFAYFKKREIAASSLERVKKPKEHLCKNECIRRFESDNGLKCTFRDDHYELCCKSLFPDTKNCANIINCTYCCCAGSLFTTEPDVVEQSVIKEPVEVEININKWLLKILDKALSKEDVPENIVVSSSKVKRKVNKYLEDNNIVKRVFVFPDKDCKNQSALYISAAGFNREYDNEIVNTAFDSACEGKKCIVQMKPFTQINVLTDLALNAMDRLIKENIVNNTGVPNLLSIEEINREAIVIGRAIPPPVVKDPIGFCIGVANKIYPGAAAVDKARDANLCELADTEIDIEALHFEINTAKVRAPTEKRFFRSKINTGVAPRKIMRQKTILHSLVARNLNVPNVTIPQHVQTVIADTYNSFLEKACNPSAKHLIDYYQRPENAIVLNKENINEWIQSQPAEKLQYLVNTRQSLCASRNDIQFCGLMIKSDGKIDTSGKDLNMATPSQVVVYGGREFNAAWSPLFIELRARLFSILKPNVLINMKKNRDEIEEFLNHYDDPRKNYNYIENDFSKYDKSQQEMALEIEFHMYKLLGLHPTEYEVWVFGNSLAKVRSMDTGLTLWFVYQRRSGFPPTALGNSIVNITTIMRAYRAIVTFEYVIIIGDDSIICVLIVIDCGESAHILATVYNLCATTIQSPYGYFCSAFIVKTENGMKFMSDPLKRWRKLGSYNATEETKIFDMYQSYKDLLSNYNCMHSLERLADAVEYRYALTDTNVLPILVSLYNLTLDYKIYRNIYEKEITVIGF